MTTPSPKSERDLVGTINHLLTLMDLGNGRVYELRKDMETVIVYRNSTPTLREEVLDKAEFKKGSLVLIAVAEDLIVRNGQFSELRDIARYLRLHNFNVFSSYQVTGNDPEFVLEELE